MGKKFASLRLEQDAWENEAFDAKGQPFELGKDAFPLHFRFERKDTEDMKIVHIEFSEDWAEVKQEEFGALRMKMTAWNMTACDCKGKSFDMNAEEVQLGIDSFPLQFKFTRK